MTIPKKVRQIALALLTYTTALASSGLFMDTDKKCGGVERWGVKVLSDKDAGKVKFGKPIETTIPFLQGLETESYNMAKHSPRCDLEKTVYTVKNVLLSEVIKEADDDMHLVLKDKAGNKLIAEIPYFDCDSAKASGLSSTYKQVRNTVLNFKAKLKTQRFNVTGVAFIDVPHPTPQHGVSPNNIELHPVLNIEPIK